MLPLAVFCITPQGTNCELRFLLRRKTYQEEQLSIRFFCHLKSKEKNETPFPFMQDRSSHWQR